jgi:hypothetical protein
LGVEASRARERRTSLAVLSALLDGHEAEEEVGLPSVVGLPILSQTAIKYRNEQSAF